MSNGASILATVGLDRSSFKTESERLKDDLKTITGSARDTAGAIAVLERQLAGGNGSTEKKKQLSDLKASYRELTREMKLMEAQQRALDAASGKGGGGHGGGEHGGGGRSAGMEAGHSVRSIFDMMGAGGNLESALQMELPRLLQASGKGLGTMIGVEIAVSIAKGLAAAIQSPAIEREKFSSQLGGSPGGFGTSTTGAIKSQIEELQKAHDEMLDATGNGKAGNDGNIFGWAARMGKDGYRKLTGNKSVEDETDDRMVTLDQRRIALSMELVKRKAEALALDARAAVAGEDSVAADRERLALKEKIRDVQDDKSLDGTAQAQLVDLLREESKLRQEHIAQVKEQHEAEAEARHANAGDRVRGDDTSVTKAENALKEAERKRLATREGSPERVTADDAVSNARSDLRDSRQADAEKRAVRKESTRLAGLTGPQARKEREALEGEDHDLAAQLDPGSPTYQPSKEKQEDIMARQAQAAAKRRALERADQARDFQRQAGQIDTQREPGTKGELAAIEKKQSLNRDRALDNDKHEQDEDVYAKLNAESAELARRKQAIGTENDKLLRQAKEQTAALELQISGHGKAAQEAKVRAGYEERIATALKNGNAELANQLSKEQALAGVAAQIARERMTPEQRSAEQHEHSEDARAAYRIQNRQQRHAQADQDNVVMNPIPDNAEIPENTGMNFRDLGRNQGSRVLVSATNRSPQVQPDRRPTATADPQAQTASGGFSDTNIVSGLRDVKTAIEKISFKGNPGHGDDT